MSPRVRESVAAVTALLLVGLVTVAWWALALWPVGGDAPAWLLKTREVCFGSAPDGLPDAAGWLALVLQPTIMSAVAAAVWGRALGAGLRTAARRPIGRLALGGLAAVILALAGVAGRRVATAPRWVPAEGPVHGGEVAAVAFPDRMPGLGLVDQFGDTLTWERLGDRPVLLTFAFAHCETVCPLIVQQVRRARRVLADEAPAVVVVTLDPWRDVPSRLPAIAAQWRLAADEHVVSGPVETVEAVLDAWRVPRSRDPVTGDVVHPWLVYFVADATVHRVSGDAEQLTRLVQARRAGRTPTS